jgi:hypothetical protein
MPSKLFFLYAGAAAADAAGSAMSGLIIQNPNLCAMGVVLGVAATVCAFRELADDMPRRGTRKRQIVVRGLPRPNMASPSRHPS